MFRKNLILLAMAVMVFAPSYIKAEEEYDCSKGPPKVDFKSCCPLPELVSEEIKDHCKAYIPEETAKETGTRKGKNGRRGPPSPHFHCLMSCFMNETGFFVNDELNKPILIDYLKNGLKVSGETMDVLEKSFETCTNKIKEIKEIREVKGHLHKEHPQNHEDKKTGLQCDHMPARLGGCVYKQSFISCPKDLWKDSAECNEVLQFKKTCKWRKHGRPGKPPKSTESSSSESEQASNTKSSESNQSSSAQSEASE